MAGPMELSADGKDLVALRELLMGRGLSGQEATLMACTLLLEERLAGSSRMLGQIWEELAGIYNCASSIAKQGRR